LATIEPAAGEPLFTLADEGRTFLYRARPGESPGTVAAMFGIEARDMPTFLAANGIKDPTRVQAGFVYRVANPVVVETAALQEQSRGFQQEVAELRKQVDTLQRDLRAAEARSDSAEGHAARAARLERLWPVTLTVIGLLGVALAGAGVIAARAASRQNAADAYARNLARELEEKRRLNLAERQESGRRILELENRARDLEAKLGPRVISGGRS
jgi:hypothetical protein